VRDWLIGGLTGLTIAKAGSIKDLLVTFSASSNQADFALTSSAAIIYAVLGFFFMFFQRELIFNVLLARSRAERGKLEGSVQTSQVIQRLLVRLPLSVLSGIDYVDDLDEVKEKEVKALKDQLYSDDVQTFLEQADEAAKGGSVDWDIAAKSAYIHYFRTYFDQESESSELDEAISWIIRALNMNPKHVDLTMKYADMLGAKEDYDSAALVLERIVSWPEAPVLVREWLGYYLRFMPAALDDAIRYSEEYHRIFPDETDTFFNVAYAYAHKYCLELRASQKPEDLESKNRQTALSTLKEALRHQPKWVENVRSKWTKAGQGSECLSHDKEFRLLVGLSVDETPNSSATTTTAASNAKTTERGSSNPDSV
jgi:tetratricopeptide (TPR) repeat protein